MEHQPTTVLNDFEFFPHLMVRYASGPHAEFESLRYPELESTRLNYEALTAELQQLKDGICDYLYQAVPDAPTLAEKQLLIGIKRDIYNDRQLAPGIWESFMTILPQAQLRKFEAYFELKTRLVDFKSAWQNNYDIHLLQQRRHLQQLSKNELLQKGLRLSSKVLFEQLEPFASAPVGSFRPKELRQEYSLLRYLTRMYFKTSPFSTFTYLGLCDLSKEHLLDIPVSSPVYSHIRLNNEIFSYLKTMLSLNPQINEQLYVKFNPTIITKGEQVTFLVNFHNLESFQKTANTPVIQALLQILDGQILPLRLADLSVKLAEVADSTEPETKVYLLKLVDIGFLEFDFQTSGVSPEWDKIFQENLKGISDPGRLLTETIEVLGQQRNNCQLYSQSGSHQRGAILESMFRQFSSLYDHLLKGLGFEDMDKEAYRQQYKASFDMEKFKKNPYLIASLSTEKLIYEDCFTPSPAHVNHEAMKEIVARINEICDLLGPLDASKVERNRMNAFFLSQYGKSRQIAVLDFYHEYYAQVKNLLLDLPPSGAPDEHQQAFTLLYTQWVEELKELLTAEIHLDAEEISLNKHIMERMTPERKRSATRVSRGMFAQCFVKDGNLQAVVNNVFLGMGRASGRFLHLFDPLITEKLQEYNNRVSQDCMLMELSDGSYFNANSHPPLLPFELRIPDGHNSLPASSQIQVKDILVYFDETEEQLCLRHRITGKRILPFDLCLQSLSQRSKLYQLLANFSLDQSVSFLPIQRAIQQVMISNLETSGKREIYYFPRIVYEEKVILKRKSWSVLTSFVPQKADQQTDAEYFMTINQWREKNNFPHQVFLYLRPRSSDNAKDASDDYKPQYIRFDTPMLILLWCRLLKKAGEYIYFEEMMPDTETLADHPVNELLVQWYMN